MIVFIVSLPRANDCYPVWGDNDTFRVSNKVFGTFTGKCIYGRIKDIYLYQVKMTQIM